ncbi:MAG: peptidase, partial [Sphingomonadaceae bacterium]|nr:peptidase [Sphingomonadaceae bacterium]
PVTVCGEMGGRTLEAMALIGIGIEHLSITPAAVGAIKAMVRSLDAEGLREAMEEWLTIPPENMRQTLLDWAEQRAVAIA